MRLEEHCLLVTTSEKGYRTMTTAVRNMVAQHCISLILESPQKDGGVLKVHICRCSYKKTAENLLIILMINRLDHKTSKTKQTKKKTVETFSVHFSQSPKCKKVCPKHKDHLVNTTSMKHAQYIKACCCD